MERADIGDIRHGGGRHPMNFEQVMLILATLIGALTTIFGQDLRLLVLKRFGTRWEGDAAVARSDQPRSRSRPWLLASAILLAGAFLVVAASRLMQGEALPRPNSRESAETGPAAPLEGRMAKTADVQANGANEAQPDAASPLNEVAASAEPSVPQPADQPLTVQDFDWRRFRGNVPLWYRTGRDNPRSIYVDAASVEQPTPSTRRFWSVIIPEPGRHGDVGDLAYIKSQQRVDCDRRKVWTGQTILYAGNGHSIVSYSAAEMQRNPDAERDAVSGSNEQGLVRFVCEGPNEDSLQVLRGGNMADYVATAVNSSNK